MIRATRVTESASSPVTRHRCRACARAVRHFVGDLVIDERHGLGARVDQREIATGVALRAPPLIQRSDDLTQGSREGRLLRPPIGCDWRDALDRVGRAAAVNAITSARIREVERPLCALDTPDA
jgi:hypothetical protein